MNGLNIITSYYGEDMLTPDEMCEYARYVSDLSSLFDGGKYRVNTLLYYPFEIYAENTVPFGSNGDFIQGTDTLGVAEAGATLMKSQIRYELINKRLLLSSTIRDGYIEAPNNEKITTVVFPSINRLDPETAAFITEARERGVTVLHSGEGDIDGVDFTAIPLNVYRFRDEVRLSEYNGGITLMQRSFDGYDLFHLVNYTREDIDTTLILNDSENSYGEVDVNAREVYKIKPYVVSGEAHQVQRGLIWNIQAENTATSRAANMR